MMDRRAPAARLEPPAARHWDFPRSVAGLVLLVEYGARAGVDRDAVLAGTGVTTAELEDPSALVPAVAELTALRNLRGDRTSSTWGDGTALGLDLGQQFHVTTFGILGYALMSSRTVVEAMNLALRFLDLSHMLSAPAPRWEGSEAVVMLETSHLPVDLAQLLVERDVSAIHTVLSELVPGGVPFRSVDLEFPAAAPTQRYREVLGVLPRFRAPATCLRFDAADLGRRLPQANPHSVALAEAMCRDVVARRRGRTGITEDVRRWVTRNVSRATGMDEAARALGTSPRTLRRRLAAAGTSYQALLDEVRQALAEEMLATDVLTVEDVAQRLGYAEASSFIHAFRRWRGSTPAQFRRDLRTGRRAAPGSAG
jgi:AraC-like DNA-binding protein